MSALTLSVWIVCPLPQFPVHERVELHLPQASAFDGMGSAVAIAGTRALVGVPEDDSAQGNGSGSARVFERGADGTWTQVANLRAGDREPQEHFGCSVALGDDRALVGAEQDGSGLGAAYVFIRDVGGSWIPSVKIVPSVRGSSLFGHDVALFGERALIGSHLDDDAGDDAGAAHVFQRQPDGFWIEVAKLTASDAAPLDNFGIAVALGEKRALIGARGGNAAYVFERDVSGAWHEAAKLVSGDPNPGLFGQSVALSGERALVGDRTLGAAYVFELGLGGWSQTARLQDSASTFFGYDVALDGERALVGAYWGPSAHVFDHLPGGAWVERSELVHAPAATDWFGFSVALSGDWIAVGAPRDSDLGTGTGSSTVFKLPSPAVGSNASVPGLFTPPLAVPLVTGTWVPFDPIHRAPELSAEWIPLFVWR